jgi:hypothetical protein
MQQNRDKPPKFERMKLPEIEEEDPLQLGRGGYCDIALEVLLDLYRDAQPYGLAAEEGGGFDHVFLHVFLMVDGRPLDIYGFTTLDEMRTHFKNDALIAKPSSLKEIREAFKGHNRTVDERRRVTARLRAFVTTSLGGRFPRMR